MHITTHCVVITIDILCSTQYIYSDVIKTDFSDISYSILIG